MNAVFVLELALRISLYARCYVNGLREFVEPQKVDAFGPRRI